MLDTLFSGYEIIFLVINVFRIEKVIKKTDLTITHYCKTDCFAQNDKLYYFFYFFSRITFNPVVV